jgi:hypothetical protein
VRQARLLRMYEGALARVEPRIAPAAHVRHMPERGVADVQGQVVAGRLEYRERLLDERGQLPRRALRLEKESVKLLLDPPAQLTNAIACSRGPLGD